MNTVLIVLPILTLLMFDLGLTLQAGDFKLFLKRPRPVLLGLVGQLLLLPLIAFLLACGFGLEPVFFIGLMLIACSPGGSSSNVFSMLAKGDVALSVSLTALSSVLTLFTIPLLMQGVTMYVGAATETAVNLPVGQLIAQNLLLTLAPIVLGILMHSYLPKAAEKVHRVLSRIAFPALIFLATVFFIQHYSEICDNFGRLGGCITLLLLCCMAGGYGLARIGRLNRKEERTLLIEIGMQNAAQAIAMASSPFVFNNEQMAIPAIVYALMMNVVLLIYVKFCGKLRA